ncbi:cell division topological specificity factor MinE [Acidihalobacter aeolianus]|uniref:Cell division topological specificity factor n=1 Tax=Acidihalobacter aeolianus TaxID=2792603 RepID=A0A1D8K9Q7_9GAMM|nr:cell division topological specificity factor MinE [Acidihalobacter aeolianus]AOV17690.1 cell division topological specificity factor MinE [Acidihalobacter aeolianus]
MGLFDIFRKNKPTSSAQIAKERLQIVISHERAVRGSPDYLPRLKQDILEVIRRYHAITDEQVDLRVDKAGGREILELNVTLASETKAAGS